MQTLNILNLTKKNIKYIETNFNSKYMHPDNVFKQYRQRFSNSSTGYNHVYLVHRVKSLYHLNRPITNYSSNLESQIITGKTRCL